MDIKWWGAQEADSQNPTNEWWRIAYAVNAAAKLYEQGGIDWAYVDIPGEFYYRNTIRLRNGVMLRGTSSDTFGEANERAADIWETNDLARFSIIRH